MREEFVFVNDIPTKIVAYGRWITETPERKDEEIILIVPGNPGITEFYKCFMKLLHEKNDNCPVWIIGHSGHERHKKKNLDVPLPKLLGLREQIQQKISFIEKYVPADSRLHIMGHSMGSYVTLELLKEPTIEKRIYQTYLLFPVIDRMAEAPNGKFMKNYLKPFKSGVVFSTRLFRVFPKFVGMNSVKAFMSMKHLPVDNRDALHSLIHPYVLRQVFFLVYQQLKEIKGRDNENIKRNLHRINIIYGERDKWCLADSYEVIKRDFPEINAVMTKFNHGFFFRENEQFSNFLSEWIGDKTIVTRL